MADGSTPLRSSLIDVILLLAASSLGNSVCNFPTDLRRRFTWAQVAESAREDGTTSLTVAQTTQYKCSACIGTVGQLWLLDLETPQGSRVQDDTFAALQLARYSSLGLKL